MTSHGPFSWVRTSTRFVDQQLAVLLVVFLRHKKGTRITWSGTPEGTRSSENSRRYTPLPSTLYPQTNEVGLNKQIESRRKAWRHLKIDVGSSRWAKSMILGKSIMLIEGMRFGDWSGGSVGEERYARSTSGGRQRSVASTTPWQ